MQKWVFWLEQDYIYYIHLKFCLHSNKQSSPTLALPENKTLNCLYHGHQHMMTMMSMVDNHASFTFDPSSLHVQITLVGSFLQIQNFPLALQEVRKSDNTGKTPKGL